MSAKSKSRSAMMSQLIGGAGSRSTIVKPQGEAAQAEKQYLKLRVSSIKLNPENTRLKLRKICTPELMKRIVKLPELLNDPKNKRRLNEVDDVADLLWEEVYSKEFVRLSEYVEETNERYIQAQFTKLLSLALDIYQTKGPTQPVDVHKIYTEYFLISGERRIHGCILAGVEEVGALRVDTKKLAEKFELIDLEEASQDEIARAQIEAVIMAVHAENRNREDISFLEKVLSFDKELDFVNSRNPNMDATAVRRKIQELTGYSRHDVSRFEAIIGKRKGEMISLIKTGVFDSLYPAAQMEKQIRDIDNDLMDERINEVIAAHSNKGSALSRADMNELIAAWKKASVSGGEQKDKDDQGGELPSRDAGSEQASSPVNDGAKGGGKESNSEGEAEAPRNYEAPLAVSLNYKSMDRGQLDEAFSAFGINPEEYLSLSNKEALLLLLKSINVQLGKV